MHIPEETRRIRRVFKGLAIVVTVIVIVAGIALVFSIGRVGVGYVAVVVDPVFGTLTAKGDGTTDFYFLKTPWSNVIPIYIATDSVHMWTEVEPLTGKTTYGDFPALQALTKDGLGVEVDITVRWSISPSAVIDLYKNFPMADWKERAIIPIIRRIVRDTIVEYTALETIEKREAVGAEIEAKLITALAKEPSLANAVILSTIDLREIKLPTTFVQAIEAKLAAEQLALAAQFNKTRILVLANATAQSEIIKAQGLATSRIIIANATHEAIRILAGESSLNQSQLTNLYLILEAFKEMAQTGNVTFLVITGEGESWILQLPQIPQK